MKSALDSKETKPYIRSSLQVGPFTEVLVLPICKFGGVWASCDRLIKALSQVPHTCPIVSEKKESTKGVLL